MFSKNYTPIIVDGHNKLIAATTGLNPQYLQRLDDLTHPDAFFRTPFGGRKNSGLYFHICRLSEYLANGQKKIQPSLTFQYIREAVLSQDESKLQELKNLHTGYMSIKYGHATIDIVKSWSELSRVMTEKQGLTHECVAIRGSKVQDDNFLGDNLRLRCFPA